VNAERSPSVGPLATANDRSQKQLWDRLIELAGATTGLAALLYLVGAMTIWVRANSAGYSADTAIEHVSSARLVSLGLRGLLIVMLVAAIPTLATIGFLRLKEPLRERVPERLRRTGSSLAVAGGVVVASLALTWVNWQASAVVGIAALATAITVDGRGQKRLWLVASIASAAMLAVAASGTWALFGVTLALVVALATIRDTVRASEGQLAPRRLRLLLLALAVAAAVVAVCWQVEGPATLQAVRIDATNGSQLPKSLSDLANCPHPYLGQSADFVYVGALTRDAGATDCTVAYASEILELPRGSVTLHYVDRGQLPDVRVPSPWRKFADAVAGLGSTLRS
jgi:hypothetical protein